MEKNTNPLMEFLKDERAAARERGEFRTRTAERIAIIVRVYTERPLSRQAVHLWITGQSVPYTRDYAALRDVKPEFLRNLYQAICKANEGETREQTN